MDRDRSHRTTWGISTSILPLLLLAALSVCDMGWYFKKYVSVAPSSATRLFPADLVRHHLENGERVLATSEVPQLATCIPEGIPTAGGYDPFQVGSYVDEFRRTGAIDPDWIPDSWSPPVSWAQRLGAGLVLSSGPVREPGITPLAKEGHWFLFHVDEPVPFIDFQSASSDTEEPEPASFVWRWEGQRLFVDVDTSSDGHLLVRQTFAPGWVARSEDGWETKVEMEEPFWQRFPVPKGSWNLVLTYEPWGWNVGIGLFPLGVIGLLAWGVVGAYSVRRRRPFS